ncbi:alkene reductase [soil metagenome]
MLTLAAMSLYTPFKLGRIELPNRIVMAPMTRSRSPGNVPSPSVATYYAQRADAGLLVTEGTSPSLNGLGYSRIPGVFSPDQIKGWRVVTDAVHAKGGHIFIQLMHTGRVAHPNNMPAGGRIVAPSAIAAPGKMYTDQEGPLDHPVPAELSAAEIQAAVAEFTHAARSAIEAGADGVELHGANGYLIEQFLNTASNQRTDQYGGSVANRIRFAVEVVESVAKAIGPDRVGIRLSPYGANGGMVSDPDTDAVYIALAKELTRIGIVYLHVVDHSAMGAPAVPPAIKEALRSTFKGAFILSGGYDLEKATADLAANKGDLVAFGRPFIANPDFVTKLQTGAPLAQADHTLFFSPGDKGYIDWPVG